MLVEGVKLEPDFWNAEISGGLTVYDMYSHIASMNGSVYEFVKRSFYKVIDSEKAIIKSGGDKEVVPATTDLFWSIASICDHGAASWAHQATDLTLRDKRRELLNPMLVICLLVANGYDVSDPDPALLTGLIVPKPSEQLGLGDIVHIAWALSYLIDFNPESGDIFLLDPTAITHLNKQISVYAFLTTPERLRQLRDFDLLYQQITGDDDKGYLRLTSEDTDTVKPIALHPATEALDYVSGIAAIHAYRTLATSFVCTSSGPSTKADEQIVRCSKGNKPLGPIRLSDDEDATKAKRIVKKFNPGGNAGKPVANAASVPIPP